MEHNSQTGGLKKACLKLVNSLSIYIDFVVLVHLTYIFC